MPPLFLSAALVSYLLEQITAGWASVFAQERRLQRALAVAFGILCGVGKRTVTRAISFHGNTQKDGSADYKVFSRSQWDPRALFNPILGQAIREQKLKTMVISTDDTRVWRRWTPSWTGSSNGRNERHQPDRTRPCFELVNRPASRVQLRRLF